MHIFIRSCVIDLPVSGGRVIRAHARRAHQGHGAGPRRAHQSARRLRTGGGLERHRRPDQPGAFHHSIADEHAGPARRGGSPERHAAAQERRGGIGSRRHAGIRKARPDHRHHGQFHRECQKPARRFAAGDAAARTRRADLRHRAGQPDRQRIRRRRQRRLEAHGQCAEFRPDSERRHHRTRGADADRAGRRHHPQSQRSGFHHRDASGGEREQRHGRRAPPPSSTAARCG